MILKIKRIAPDREWYILDNIRRVSICPSIEGDTKNGKDLGLDVTEYDVVLLDNHTYSGNVNYLYKILICRLIDNSEFSIIFDTIAYLCNDEGKTIEKIVA